MDAKKSCALELTQHALRLLANRPHSVFEIRTKLVKVCWKRKQHGKRAGSFRGILNCNAKSNVHPTAASAKYKEVDCGEVVDDAVSVLIDAGSVGGLGGCLLDDKSYSEWHVQQRASHQRRSALQIRAELAAKGIDRSLADEALQEYDEYSAAIQIVQRLVQQKSHGGSLHSFSITPTIRFELKKALFAKGFTPDTVQKATDEVLHSFEGIHADTDGR